MRNAKRTIAYVLCAVFLPCASAFSWSGTTQVASEGKPLPTDLALMYGWPDGVLNVLNDPLRTNGWNPFFSECSSDVKFYEIQLRENDDVRRIVAKFSEIRSDETRILLSPTSEARGFGFSSSLPEGNGTAAVFSIGVQETIDQWYRSLPEIEPGVRKFGVHRYTECPQARPPTLTLYVGNEAIDLSKLEVPAEIEVVGALAKSYREKHNNDPIVKAIDAFVADHQSKRTAE